MRCSHLPHAKFSLQLVEFLLRYAMGIMFGMFWSAFWVFSTQKCEAVIFAKFRLACMHTRKLDYLDTLVLHRACAPFMHAHIAHARCEITRFAYNVNHIIMTSSVFHSLHAT